MLTPSATTSWQHETSLVAVRDDLGRHKALGRLAGASGRAGAHRVSVETVQATAVIGASLLVAVSAPHGRNHARGHRPCSRLSVFIPPRPVCEQATVHVT
jgi:FdhD/NarQ family